MEAEEGCTEPDMERDHETEADAEMGEISTHTGKHPVRPLGRLGGKCSSIVVFEHIEFIDIMTQPSLLICTGQVLRTLIKHFS